MTTYRPPTVSSSVTSFVFSLFFYPFFLAQNIPYRLSVCFVFAVIHVTLCESNNQEHLKKTFFLASDVHGCVNGGALLKSEVKFPLKKKQKSFSATNGNSSPSRHFGSSFGSHSRADYEPVGALQSEKGAGQTNGARYTNTTGGSNEMYDIPVGTFLDPILAILFHSIFFFCFVVNTYH